MDELKPLISFVLPTHNRIEWVAEAITSILGQTERNIELVIVDDGSTDGTKEMLEEWPKDERVKVYRNEKSIGGGPSRHLGAEKATGEIICIMDDDDICVDERAKKTLAWFQENPNSELVNFPYVSIGYNNDIMESYDGSNFDHEDFKKTGNVSYYCNPSAAMKKQAYFETDGYKKETDKVTDDRQFIENWVKSGKKVDFCPGDPVLLHRVLPDSMCVKFRGFDPSWVEK